MATDPEGIFSLPVTIAFNLGFHVVAFLTLSYMLQASGFSKSSRWPRLLLVGRWLLLFPSPCFTLGFLLAGLDIPSKRGIWIHNLYNSRWDALRFPPWRRVGQMFRPMIRRFWKDLSGLPPLDSTLPEEGRAFNKREALARLKVLFLPAEAGLLTWLVAQGLKWQPQPYTQVALLVILLILTIGNLLLHPLSIVAEKLRWNRLIPLAPYLRSDFLLATAGCFLGIFGGAGAARGNLWLVSMALDLLATFLAFLGLVSFWRGLARNRVDLGLVVSWSSLYLVIIAFEAVLKASPDLAKRAVILALAAPILGLAAGLVFSPALLRPFTWRHLLDKQLPVRFRAVLAAVGLTAILPLGGLAEPLWIWARQRLWPRHVTQPRVATLSVRG